MASLADGGAPAQINPQNYRADQGFFLGISVALSLLTAAGFLQLALRGITDPIGAPVQVHIHALFLVGWLAVFCTQNWLAWSGNIAWHRKLGWAALLLVACIVVANYYVTYVVIVEDRMGAGGFDTPSSFLALGAADTLSFAGLVAWAIARRRDTQWHRRLMFGATLMLSAAGLNRLLIDVPPTIAPFLSIGAQYAFLTVIALHDRKMFGKVHGATIAVAIVVLVQHAIPFVFPMIGPWNSLVDALVG